MAAGIKPLYEEQAKARQEATQFKDGQAPVPKNSWEPVGRRESSAQAGEQVGVSAWSVESYERVEKNRPDLADKIKATAASVRFCHYRDQPGGFLTCTRARFARNPPKIVSDR